MTKTAIVIRWGVALIAAAIAYTVVIVVVPMLEGNVKAISPTVLVLNSALLATAAGVIVGGFVVPRTQIRLARRYLPVLGVLTPIGRAVWDFAHSGGMHHNYLMLLLGGFAGAMLGVFVLIVPKPPRQAQPRRFS